MSDEDNRLLNEINKRLKNIENMLHGEGEQPGIKGRLAALETERDGRARVLWLTITAVVSAVASAIFSIFKH